MQHIEGHYLKQLDHVAAELRRRVVSESGWHDQTELTILQVLALHSEALARISRDLKRLKVDLEPLTADRGKQAA